MAAFYLFYANTRSDHLNLASYYTLALELAGNLTRTMKCAILGIVRKAAKIFASQPITGSYSRLRSCSPGAIELQYDPVARRLELEMHFSAHRSQPTKLTKARRRPTQLAATNTQAFATLPPESPTSSESELFRFGLLGLAVSVQTYPPSSLLCLNIGKTANRDDSASPIFVKAIQFVLVQRQCRCHI